MEEECLVLHLVLIQRRQSSKRHLLKYNLFDYDKNSGIYGLHHFGENKFILTFLFPGRVRQQLFYLFIKI